MKKLGVFLAFMFMVLPAHADLPASVLLALKKAGIPQQNVAVYVWALEDNKLILSHNADKSMNPASVMKLVTTNAALDLLGPAYRWKTEVYRDGELVNGVLQGDLIIKAYGDPRFKAHDFWRLLMALQQAGIHEIKGDLIIDKSYFAKNLGEPPVFDDEIWRGYNAAPSAFLVNGRNTSFKLSAHDIAVSVNQEFELNEVQVMNNIKLTQGACGDWRSRLTYAVKSSAHNVSVIFGGVFSAECGERYLELSVLDDDQYAFFTFKKIWKELGGKFNGQLKIQDTKNHPIKVLEQLSEPLGDVIRDINKWSNNVMARQLLLTLAAQKLGDPATPENGAAVIKGWLADRGAYFNELVIENGAGLSRAERISAEHLGQMLTATYHSAVMPELMSSLPILSLDGTTKKRLNDRPSSARAHLKTGSLNGVSAIAGYVLDANNHRNVLVMFVNHPLASASKSAEDALIEWTYQQP